jgi:hypothetical protein
MFDCDQEWVRKYRAALDNQPLPRLFRLKELLRKLKRDFRSFGQRMFAARNRPANLQPAIPVPMKPAQAFPTVVAEHKQSAKAS